MNPRFLITAVGVVIASPVGAANWCHPIDNTARILASLNPNDIHKDWSGESYIGTGWALAPGRAITADGTAYIEGDLYSPRGGLVNRKVYVLRKEWLCGD